MDAVRGDLVPVDAFGSHSLGENVRAASVAFDPFGQKVPVITLTDGSQVQADGSGPII
jgi:hypothetical protein